MATITKRTWTTTGGEPRQAWVLAYNDKQGNRHKQQFSTKRAADAKRVEIEGQVQGGTYRSEAQSKTVHDACKGYLEHLSKRQSRGERVTEHYYRTTKAQLYNYVSPQPDQPVTFSHGIGKVKLTSLTTGTVAAFRDNLRDEGVGVVTTRRILGCLSRAIKWARSQDWMAINPVEGVPVTGRRDEGSKKVTPPSKASIASVLKSAPPPLNLWVRFAAATGLRASEQWALVWGNINFEAKEITVDRRVDAWRNVDVTKSEAGGRTIPISATLVAALKEHKLATRRKDADDLVFQNSKGGFIDHRNMITRHWNPLMAKLTLQQPAFVTFHWHAFRHFAISTWIEAGLKPKTVQTFAGHSTLGMTMDRYGHLFPKDDHRDAMDKIAAEIFD